MSAKQTKGCPFPEEKVALPQARTERFFFLIFMLYKKTPRPPLKPRGLILCPERQSMQSALWCKESESAKCPF